MVDAQAKRKVIVIDDSAIALEAVRVGLEARGFAVIVLQSPIGSAIVIGRERPDAVLVDMSMASMSGEAVVKGLKTRKSASVVAGPRVLLYSDRTETELAEAAGRSGADGWVRKGGDMDQLARAISGALSAR